MKNSLSKRVLSLLLCLAMFLSLGFSAFAEPVDEEDARDEAAEIVMPETPASEEEKSFPAAEALLEETDLPTETRDGESAPSFTISGTDKIIIRNDERKQVSFTLEALNLGMVSVDATDETPAHTSQAVAMYVGTVGYSLEDEEGHSINYLVDSDMNLGMGEAAFTENYTPDDVPEDFSFYVQANTDDYSWMFADMHPGAYSGYMVVADYWVCEDGSE